MSRFAALAALAVAALTFCAFTSTAGAAPALAAPPSTNLNCKPFHNTTQVIAFARKTLIYNGFHPNIEFSCGAKWVKFLGVIDGEEYQGAIQRTGKRQIVIGISEHPAYPPGRALYTDSSDFTVPFDV